jgi:hypothetical protein
MEDTMTDAVTTARFAERNAPTFEQLLSDAAELGKEGGRGGDGITRLLLRTAETSFGEAADVQKHKHGRGVDDAAKIADAYIKGRSDGTLFDIKGPPMHTMRSRVRLMIKLGRWEKGGAGEPLSTLNSLITLHLKLRKEGSSDLEDAPNAILRFAREQIKRDSVISAPELRTFCFKKEPQPKTEEDFVEAECKRWQKAKVGKDGFSVDADMADEIIGSCTKRLEAIATAKRMKPAEQLGTDAGHQRM